MKTTIMGEITPLNTTEQAWYDRFQKLNKQCTTMDIFEHEGRMYYGSHINAIKTFIENNPHPADFSVWLQGNWTKV